MAMTSNIPVPLSMDCTGDVAGNWKFFISSWTDYENATELSEKSMKIRIATFCSVLGRDAQRILQHLQFNPPDKREDLPSVIEALQQHFVPQRNEVFERYVFNTAFQEQGESVDSYVTRLRKLAVTCKFAVTSADNLSYEDNMIRDRLILGTTDLETRARTFREREMDLGKIIRMLKTSEAASKQLCTISEQATEAANVNFAKKMTYNKDTTSQKQYSDGCRYCGKRHGPKCPAYGKVCTKCQKRNHFVAVCKSQPRINYVEHTQSASAHSDDFEVNCVDYYVATITICHHHRCHHPQKASPLF